MIIQVLEWLLFAVIGGAAGLMTGMFGVGGGIVTVPALNFLFSTLQIAPGLEMELAIGTSLTSVVINSTLGTFRHHKRQNVNWTIVKRMAPGLLVGSVLGAFIATLLTEGVLKLFFGVFLCILAIQFIRPIGKMEEEPRLPGPFLLNVLTMITGAISNLLGIGGGIMIVPMLLHYKMPARKAVACASATTVMMAFLGAASYMYFGLHKTVKIPLTLGYVYIPAFLMIAPCAFFMARKGVDFAHVLPEQTMRRLFAGILIVSGLSILFF